MGGGRLKGKYVGDRVEVCGREGREVQCMWRPGDTSQPTHPHSLSHTQWSPGETTKGVRYRRARVLRYQALTSGSPGVRVGCACVLPSGCLWGWPEGWRAGKRIRQQARELSHYYMYGSIPQEQLIQY